MKLTVAQALVRFLAEQYSERDGEERRLIGGVWGIFGHGNVAGLGQALEELGDEVGLTTYRPQNEQAMVHLAAAYARHHLRLSTLACTTSIGPGATNMLTGAAAATINHLPVLLLPSDYFANHYPDPALQQLEHPAQYDYSVNDAFRPVSRFFARIQRPEQLLSALPEAMRVLSDPVETGAVTVALPEDLQTEAFDWPPAFFAKRVYHVSRPLPEPEQLARAAQLLTRAQRPLIVVGGGVVYADASAELDRLAAAFGVPAVFSQAGKGALAWDHPQNAGPLGGNGGRAANTLARQADFVLAIGTRLGDFVTASRSIFTEGTQVVALNLNPPDAAKLGALPLIADAKRGLEGLIRLLQGLKYRGTEPTYRREVQRRITAWRQEVGVLREPQGEHLAQTEVIGLVNKAFGEDATVICAAGSLPGDLLRLWRAKDPRAYHVEYGYSCMGYEIPAGLGVKLAEPEREVVVFIGDGSYLMMNSELVTAAVENLEFTVILVDNHGFGSILGLQRSVGSPSFNNELRARNPRSGRLDAPVVGVDFAKHAEAMGAKSFRARSAAELKEALALARAARGVRLIVVEVGPNRSLDGGGWWDVPVAEVSVQEEVRRARKAYDAARVRRLPFWKQTR